MLEIKIHHGFQGFCQGLPRDFHDSFQLLRNFFAGIQSSNPDKIVGDGLTQTIVAGHEGKQAGITHSKINLVLIGSDDIQQQPPRSPFVVSDGTIHLKKKCVFHAFIISPDFLAF